MGRALCACPISSAEAKPCIARSAPTLDRFVLANSADTHTAYNLVCKLQASVLPPDQRMLDILTTLDELEASLLDRAPALAGFAAVPGASPTTIVAALLAELTAARTPVQSSSTAAAAGALMHAAVLSNAAFDNATTKSAAFQTLSAAVIAQPLFSIQDRIDLIALGFNGDCVITVRCMLSMTPGGDADAPKNAALQRLNSMRGERYLYFNYMLTVDPNTGVVPQRLQSYEFAAPTSMGLLDQFLRRQYSTMEWIPAPHGVMGYCMCDDGKKSPEICNPLDFYCVPTTIKALGLFGDRLFRALGTSPGSPGGFTFDGMCGRHIEQTSRPRWRRSIYRSSGLSKHLICLEECLTTLPRGLTWPWLLLRQRQRAWATVHLSF